MGHELGHNLNLEHTFADPANLMNFLFPHGMMLTEEQVAIILQSPLVQTGPSGQKFIQITPIAIVAISEPATLLLLGSSLGMLLIATAISWYCKAARTRDQGNGMSRGYLVKYTAPVPAALFSKDLFSQNNRLFYINGLDTNWRSRSWRRPFRIPRGSCPRIAVDGWNAVP